MDMSKTLSDLPTDLHQLILSHDEEKIELKKENEKLKTRVKMLQCLLDEARQDSDSDEDTDDEDDGQSKVDDDTILSGIVCNKCQTVLPSLTAKEHLDINNPINKCPHVRDSQYSEVCDK